MRALQAGEAETAIRTVVDPKSYFRWLGILQSEVGNFSKEKWRDALKAVNPPERMGSAEQFESERWYAALATRPNAASDVWDYVRDWEEFQDYLMAATSVMKSPLLEGRLASLRVPSSVVHIGRLRGMKAKLLDQVARQAHRLGAMSVSHDLCVYREKWARIEAMIKQADDWFREHVVDRMDEKERAAYIQSLQESLKLAEQAMEQHKVTLESPSADPEKKALAHNDLKYLPDRIEALRADLAYAQGKK